MTKFDPSGSTLVYSTYLGGNFWDEGRGITVNAAGSAYITGVTDSLNFPTQNPYQPVLGGGYDAFVTKLNSTGSGIVYSSYLGGGGNSYFSSDYGQDIGVDVFGHAHVTGYTESFSFPLQNPFQGIYGGFKDAFLAKLETLPLGVNRYGLTTAACQGTIAIDITDIPKAGITVNIISTNAPPNGQGVLLLGSSQDVMGTIIAGVTLHVNLAQQPVLTLPVTSDGNGYGQMTVPIPAGAIGLTAYGQFIWANTSTCGGNGTLSASDALAITVQP